MAGALGSQGSRGHLHPYRQLPKYDDLKRLFKERINKDYPRDLYDKQFSLYIDKIVARLDLQIEAYGKEENMPLRCSKFSRRNGEGLIALKEKYGPIVTPQQLEAEAENNAKSENKGAAEISGAPFDELVNIPIPDGDTKFDSWR